MEIGWGWRVVSLVVSWMILARGVTALIVTLGLRVLKTTSAKQQSDGDCGGL